MPQSASRGLAAWPIRRKLITLVAVPVVVIMVAGIWLTASSISGLRAAERTRALATAALTTNRATVALDDELNATLIAHRASSTATKKALVDSRVVTDKAINSLNSYLDTPPSGGWSPDVLMAASSMKLQSVQLAAARQGTDAGKRSPLVIERSYHAMFTALRNLTSALSREIAVNTADGTTVDQSSMLAALSSAASAAADERARGAIAISENRLSAAQLTDIKQLGIEQNVQLNIAYDHATLQEQSDIDAIRMDDTRIGKFRKDLDDLAAAQANRDTNQPVDDAKAARDQKAAAVKAGDFADATGQRLKNLDDLVARIADTTKNRASDNVRDALIGTILLGALTVIVLLLIFATVAAIARTVTGPMRRLRSGAVEVATVRLPQAVRQIEQQGIDATIDLPPVMPPGTVAGPETLEVAHAVDGLTAEAVRLATAQVRLRHALDEAFVSMSRRSQTMVEKQLAIIDELESTEEDPEQLRNLFRLDHLAARMRRYNDNLLVLAGSSVRTRSNTPVPVSDVFRAATSEMEQYERVRLQPVNNAAVAGPVAGGLIHLLAELLDNAAMYSPPTSPILLTAAFTPGGGLHLEVTDSGVGIPPAELAELNARLATPGTIDTQIPSRMGLFVVGRLAQRGGFEVRLSARASAAGTVAEVLVPATHVVGAPQGGQEGPAVGRIPAPQQRTPGPLSPQSLPTAPGGPGMGMPGMPGMPPLGRPPAGLPTGAPGGPPAGPPSSVPSPSLPRRPNLVWPGADQAAPAAAGPGTGSLPSRVPGAALSGNPLAAAASGRNGADSSFDAFGGPLGTAGIGTPTPPPPGAAPIGGPSATAAWSAQARAARAGGTPGMTGPGAPGGPGRPGDPSNGAGPRPFGSPAPFGAPPGGGFGGPPGSGPGLPGGPGGPAGPGFPGGPGLPGGGPSALAGGSGAPPGLPGSGPSGLISGPPSGLPSRQAPGGDQPGSGLPPRTPSAFGPPPGGPVGRPPMPGSPADEPSWLGPNSGGLGGLPEARGDRPGDTSSSGPGPLPLRPARGGADPFATAKLFGVEMPDPATAAGLFTAGPKVGSPDTTGTGTGHRFGDGERNGMGHSGPAERPGLPGDEAALDGPPEARGSQPSGPSGAAPSDTVNVPEHPAALTGELPRFSLKPLANPSTAESGGTTSNGAAPAAWDSVLPTEQEARAATAGYTPTDLDAPMIGNLDYVTSEFASPIFESMSVWFSDPKTVAPQTSPDGAADQDAAEAPVGGDDRGGDDRGELADQGDDVIEALPARTVQPGDDTDDRPPAAASFGTGSVRQDAARLIDLHDDKAAAKPTPVASKWASLGDQQWLAANARAAAAPQIAGDTAAGLPRRQPGANLLPSAASAAPGAPTAASAPFHKADADAVRGRLGSFQRGVSSARQNASRPGGNTSTTAASLFTAARTTDTDQGHTPDEQGGEQ